MAFDEDNKDADDEFEGLPPHLDADDCAPVE